MPFFSQELWEQAEMTATNKAAENANVRAVNKTAAGPDGIDRLLREHKVDALIAPTVGPAWPSDLMTLNLQTNTSVRIGRDWNVNLFKARIVIMLLRRLLYEPKNRLVPRPSRYCDGWFRVGTPQHVGPLRLQRPDHADRHDDQA